MIGHKNTRVFLQEQNTRVFLQEKIHTYFVRINFGH